MPLRYVTIFLVIFTDIFAAKLTVTADVFVCLLATVLTNVSPCWIETTSRRHCCIMTSSDVGDRQTVKHMDALAGDLI